MPTELKFSRLAALVGAIALVAAIVIAAVVLLGGLDEWRQASIPGRVSDAQDFLADLCAAAATGWLLFMQRKTTCAESSRQ